MEEGEHDERDTDARQNGVEEPLEDVGAHGAVGPVDSRDPRPAGRQVIRRPTGSESDARLAA
jgi:hypothetical protein